ncbi:MULTISPECIES: nuclear transport factor 2 family protein [unclassified Ruegeria]|uniref:nuclear transport factor 2 family protein n=1 Tax=unclassified Ruegeria TaxID=2625375 RepID=UPI001ADB53FE|nr:MULTISPECIES: nuclear transport factor 2 family protein [unclassified Ruegeria]MBO9412154.1 nuclear transport factor 2 family protein [Ruegeria sp. R8_1]MBO9417540.1 nuclear transport factor 2 family protein [Ruegeria sp. R8_2]
MKLSIEDKAALEQLEESLWTAETRFDPKLMDQTFDIYFVEFGRSGRRYEKSDMLMDANSDTSIGATLPLSDYSVELVAPDVALATYTSELRQGDSCERARRSSLWIKVEGCWRLRFHQGTPC